MRFLYCTCAFLLILAVPSDAQAPAAATEPTGYTVFLRGAPIGLLRHVAHKDPNVEDVQAFGDRLHIRVGEDQAQVVLGRLTSQIRSEGGQVDELRLVPPGLEDVFIALSESK